jgi:imidazolonepropionase-like amidohydrolase
VKWFGYDPEEALLCATRNGALAMQMEEEIGKIRKGYLADFIVVRGRPHRDVSCIRSENILLVVKDRQPYGRNEWQFQSRQAGEDIALR